MKAEPTASGGAGAAGGPDPREAARADTHLMRSLLIGIFILMTVYALYFGRAFFMPGGKSAAICAI